jgi:ribonuclease E
MSKEIYISSTPHETRLAIVEKDELTEIYYERENEYTLAGSIYNGRVTRVLPGMQSSFVDIGLERDAFLYITDFMEEAGDAAVFESAAGVNGATSADSAGGGRGRDGERPARAEGRDRGRARREERGREGQNGAGKESAPATPQVLAPVDEEGFRGTSGAADGEEIGEGAPGADGSRRWRGRRGRRRGKTNGEQGAEGSATSERSESAPEERSPEYEERTERAPHQDRDGEDRAGRDRGDRDRSRGGERGSQSGAEHGSREGRHNAVRERFAPRGGGSRESNRESNQTEGVEIAAGAERFILPGESLSKYRRGDQGMDAPSAKSAGGFAAQVVKPRPSSEVQPLVGWDGGLVLPGETLSRHRGQPAEGSSVTHPEARGSSHEEASSREYGDRQAEAGRDRSADQGRERGRDRRRERDERRGGGREGAPRIEYSARPQQLDPGEAVLPAVTSQHEPEANVLPFSDDAPGFEVRETESRLDMEQRAADNVAAELQDSAICEPETDAIYGSQLDAAHVEAAESAQVEEPSEAAEEFHETVAEYEPEEDASASFRVDPAGASEFRQSLPVQEFVVSAEEEAGEAADAAHDRELEHAFTAVQSSGEMISESAREEEAPHGAAAPSNSETAPIEHETAVQSVHLAEASSVPFAANQNGSLSASFAPGDGQLEEELLDEEEGEIGGLQASAFDDDTEEESLESAAGHAPDLGSMIRDMSIDEITRAEPAELDEDDDEDEDDFEDDEEDLEEEDLEHDNLEHDDLEQDGLEHGEDELDSEVSGHDISEVEEEEFAEAGSFGETRHEAGRESGNAAFGEGAGANTEGQREAERHGRQGGRSRSERGGGRGQRDRRGSTNTRSGGSGRGHGDRGGGRTMQATDLPAISDLLKPGQEVLVQIAKEPIAKKGARITSHIALPGRFLVFMPTVGHIGVSRKIESDGERRRLKEILLSERGEASGGFIVRTAASGASEEELRSDLRFLLNLWADIKQRSESSKSPALIYHDLNLVERILRDQVTDNFSAIWVDTETEYERVLRFLQRFQPSLIRRVKLYTKDTPLFEQFGISAEIDKALRSKVWLKSGGSIVINQTEALVAIDINTGKFVGKTARLEDTIVKTNLDAIPEIVRQIRLRDLGGIIIIDFIDMDERKNRNKVMAALEEELKKDRAPSKVLQFNDFGLVAITRKRVKQSLERTLSSTCGVCQGTGMTKSPVTVCNDIYIEMRKMHKLMDKGDIMLRVNPEVVKQLKSGSGKWLQEMEEMSGKTILVKSDPSLHPEQFDIH